MKSYTQTIGNIVDKYKYNQLELNPPYQRRSVWKTRQRTLLLSSIFNGIPIPALIFHKHFDGRKKKDIYDVLDGKQRIETILHFSRMIQIENESEWEIKINKTPDEYLKITFSNLISKKFNKINKNIGDAFWNYEIPVIEYEGELTDFFGNPVSTKEVFVRINSTGSVLKANEIRHAQSSVPFFKLGEDLERRNTKRFKDIWKIFSESEIHRYLFHEFILELCTILYFQKYTDRRIKMEELLTNHTWTEKEIDRIRLKFQKVIKWMRNIFSDDIFVNTRFTNKSDFYSLFVVLNNLIENKYPSNNFKENKILGSTLLEFSKTAQIASSELRKYDVKSSLKSHDRELIQYIIATRQSTDSLGSRKIRNDYLQALLKGFFLKRKDDKRIFDKNIKGVLWTRLLQRFNVPKCPNPDKNPNCKKILTYDDAQIDHVDPWCKGGRTTIGNAQLICSSCNKRKSDN